MNKKFKELRDQAWKEAYNVDPNHPRIAQAHKVMEEGIFKFGELIVQQCIAQINNLPPGYKDYREQIEDAFRRDCIEVIKQNFGIKE